MDDKIIKYLNENNIYYETLDKKTEKEFKKLETKFIILDSQKYNNIDIKILLNYKFSTDGVNLLIYFGEKICCKNLFRNFITLKNFKTIKDFFKEFKEFMIKLNISNHKKEIEILYKIKEFNKLSNIKINLLLNDKNSSNIYLLLNGDKKNKIKTIKYTKQILIDKRLKDYNISVLNDLNEKDNTFYIYCKDLQSFPYSFFNVISDLNSL